MLSKTFPGLVPVYGIVASFSFSLAYSISNIVMSQKSDGWKKKRMLVGAVIGFRMATLISASTNSLIIFALMRFLFGIFASAINTPIYQLIA